MKGCVQWDSVYSWEDLALSGDSIRATWSIGQLLTHWVTKESYMTGQDCWDWQTGMANRADTGQSDLGLYHLWTFAPVFRVILVYLKRYYDLPDKLLN